MQQTRFANAHTEEECEDRQARARPILSAQTEDKEQHKRKCDQENANINVFAEKESISAGTDFASDFTDLLRHISLYRVDQQIVRRRSLSRTGQCINLTASNTTIATTRNTTAVKR